MWTHALTSSNPCTKATYANTMVRIVSFEASKIHSLTTLKLLQESIKLRDGTTPKALPRHLAQWPLHKIID